MLLEAEHLAKRYGAFTALEDVSLALDEGEVVGFLGPNGAGKTTTMKVVTGYVAASAGRVRIDGHDLAEEPLACRRLVGYLPQDLPLYPEMRVEAYLDHVARLKGVARAGRRAQVVAAMERCAVRAVARRHIHKLSGGNRQRVGLAQALLGRPRLLVLDEATAGLDPTQVANFRHLVRSLAEDHAILLSTHILAEVEACCQRVVVVHRGRDICATSVGDLRERARKLDALRLRLRDGRPQALLAALAPCDWARHPRLEDDHLVLAAPPQRRAELVALAEAHGGLRELVEERRSLEDVFADIVAAAPAVAAPAANAGRRPAP